MLLGLAAVGLAAAAAAPDSHVIEVEFNTDEPQPACPGACSYRGALETAVKFTDGLPVHIVFRNPGHVTIGVDKRGLHQGDLPELEAPPGLKMSRISITGHHDGTILDGLHEHQLLYTKASIEVNVSNLTFLHGAATGHPNPNGGAIVNGGIMRVSNCSFVECTASGAGGAIDNQGSLTVTKSSFTNGTAGSAAGALASFTAYADATVFDTTFYNNSAGNTGGAIQNKGPRMLISGCKFDLSYTGVFGVLTPTGNNAGTIQNGCGNSQKCNSSLIIEDTTFTRSSAKGGGFIENLEDGRVTAVRVSFDGGNATGYQGGALLNSGELACRVCSFKNNEAHDPNGFPQGATLALIHDGATAVLQNTTLDASYQASLFGDGDKYPSEIFVNAPGVLLNLTFGEVTGCHPNTIFYNAGPGRDKWYLSGVHMCDDGSYSDADPPTLDDHTRGLLHDCAKTRCAQGAVCTDIVKGKRDVGTNCSCPDNPHTGLPMWGFPFGPDPYVAGSSEYGNCFDETDASLQSLDFGSGSLGEFCPLVVMGSPSASSSADAQDAAAAYTAARLAASVPPPPPPPASLLGRLYGSFVGRRSLGLVGGSEEEVQQQQRQQQQRQQLDAASTPSFLDILEDGSGSGEGPVTVHELACCAARTLEWRARQFLNFTATPNLTDHATVLSVSPSSGVVPLTAAKPTAQVSVVSESFGPAEGAHSLSGDKAREEYVVNVTLLSGEQLCDASVPGARGGPCRHPSNGSVRTCVTTPKFPKQELNGTMVCEAAPQHLGAPAGCGSYNWSACECPVCLAGTDYACTCEGADGTQTCNDDGTAVGACDCSRPYSYPPPPHPPGWHAPPPPRPGSSMTTAQLLERIVLPVGLAVVLLSVGGLFAVRRRMHQQRMRQEYAALLNVAAASQESSPRASGTGGGGPAPYPNPNYQPPPPQPASKGGDEEEFVVD